MGMSGILCALSEKRLALLSEEPSLISELIQSRKDQPIPGLLDLEKSWDALDVILSNRGADALLGDAILVRRGRPIGPKLTFGPARLLPAPRVVEIAAALRALPADVVASRYSRLARFQLHGGFGKAQPAADDTAYLRERAEAERNEEIALLDRTLVKVRALYEEAAAKGQAMLGTVV